MCWPGLVGLNLGCQPSIGFTALCRWLCLSPNDTHVFWRSLILLQCIYSSSFLWSARHCVCPLGNISNSLWSYSVEGPSHPRPKLPLEKPKMFLASPCLAVFYPVRLVSREDKSNGNKPTCKWLNKDTWTARVSFDLTVKNIFAQNCGFFLIPVLQLHDYNDIILHYNGEVEWQQQKKYIFNIACKNCSKRLKERVSLTSLITTVTGIYDRDRQRIKELFKAKIALVLAWLSAESN